MFNRSYQTRRARLQGQQLDISFPRRGRPTRIRVLERCGQLRLNLQPLTAKCVAKCNTPHQIEGFDDALQMTFPVGPMTELELEAEFHRLFPAE